MPEITAKLRFTTPTLPNFIRVAIGYSSLDEALANREGPTINVGDLDEQSIEAVIEQWGADFREHCAKRRKIEHG